MDDQRELAFMRAPYQKHSETSREAASKIEGDAPTCRGIVLRVLRAHRALTDEEIQTISSLPPSTQRPRRIELVRLGLVRDSGKIALTRSGRKAVLWEAVTIGESNG